MGLLDKIKGELVDIIEWIDDSRSTLAWRFPRYQNEIKNGAQLIVREGQKAVFVYRGALADQFDPGSYELITENLPILSTLQGWKHGFDSPFRSEVYFINGSIHANRHVARAIAGYEQLVNECNMKGNQSPCNQVG